MKKTVLSLALATVAASAQAETVEIELPEFYGKINLTQEFVQQEDAGSYSQLNSNASRLGLKGKTAINDQLTAIYQAEYEIDVDGDGDVFKQRNTFLGVKGSYGLVQAGVFDTALKASQGKVDLFNDLPGDIKNVLTHSENREANAVRYESPSLSGLVVTLDHINAEEEDVNNGLSASLVYTRDAIYVAYAYDTDVEGEGIKVQRVTGQLKTSFATFGALWETEDDNGDSNDGMLFSVSVPVSVVAVNAQYIASDIKDEGGTQYSLGAEYKLSKKAKTFIFASSSETDEDSSGMDVYGAGMELKF